MQTLQKKIKWRNLIEDYCDSANFLEPYKRMLWNLYWRDGYTTIEISQLLMVHHTTVARRLEKIRQELDEMRSNISRRRSGLSAVF